MARMPGQVVDLGRIREARRLALLVREHRLSEGEAAKVVYLDQFRWDDRDDALYEDAVPRRAARGPDAVTFSTGAEEDLVTGTAKGPPPVEAPGSRPD